MGLAKQIFLKKSVDNPRHLSLKKPIILDTVYDYLVYSYDTEDKRFIIIDRRTNENFHITKSMIDKLQLLQRSFERDCKENNCHAVSAWEWWAKQKRSHKIDWKPKFGEKKRAHWSINTKGYVTH